MTPGAIEDLALGTDRSGEAVRVGDVRRFGYWTFLRLERRTELGATLARFLEEPTEDELRHANYAGVEPVAIAEIKRLALASGLDPSTTLSAYFSLADSEDEKRATQYRSHS